MGESDRLGEHTCAGVSAALNEPMLGTSPQVGLWILLEVREPWAPKNLVTNSLPEVAQAWLADSTARAEAQGLLPRVQFIRHRRKPTDQLTVMVCQKGELRRQYIDNYQELATIDPLGQLMKVCDRPHYFICTHAKRDQCCSRLGLPTWQRLDSLSGGRAWQTTHLGGHRFAPNALTLPSARLYGRVYKDRVDGFFEQIEAGAAPAHLLRGHSALPPYAQVCEPAILAQSGRYLRSDATFVYYETTNGTQAIRIPPRTQLEVLSGCNGNEWKTVESFQPCDAGTD